MQYVRSTLTRRAAGAHRRAARLHVRLAPLLLALALGPPPVGGMAAVPVPSSTSTARHAADLRTYLDSIYWHEHALAQIPHSNVPSEREFFDAFAKATTPDEFYAKAMPIFESHIPAKEAHTLSLMASGRPVSQADKQAALEAFASIEEHAKPKLRHVWDALMDAFSQHNLERAIAEVRRSIADMAAHTEPDYIPSVGKVGLSYVDQLDSLTVTLYARQWNASKLRDSRCAAASPDNALAPATLLAPGGVAAAHRALDECERALQTQEATNEAAFKDFSTGVQAIRLVDQSRVRKQMEQASLAVHERARKLSQLHRQLLGDQRRLVSMMEARREHVRIEDGQLMFDTDDDVEQVNRIVDDIVAHGEEINDFVHQVREDSPLLRGVDLHDDVSAMAKPVGDVQ
jgi:hypothetical protein